MKVTKVSLILGAIIAGLMMGVLCFSPTVNRAAAQPESTQPTNEKQDFSRGKTGYSVLSAHATGNEALLAAGADHYGYILNGEETPNWIDAQTGTEIIFSTRDDDYAGPIEIGFELPFYENSYTELYVSTNGMISLGAENDAFENRDIPRDTMPNNYIAPFWDDLLFIIDAVSGTPISRAYYTSGTDAQGKYFVVEWNQVSRLDTQTDILTFEVVLRENGDILFQYAQLDGTLDQATVGIEDEHGIDGNIYLYNFVGLDTTQAILFEYPPTLSARAKIFPINQGAFINSGVANVEFTVRNTGDLGTDTYDLVIPPPPPGWEVTFYDAAAGQLLNDSNLSGMVDTGPIAEGDDMRITLSVQAPETAQVGDHLQEALTLVSAQDPSKSAQATFDAAIPTAFAQALQKSTVMRLHLVWRENQISASATPEQFFGSNLAVQRLTNGNYFYSWERNAPPGSEVSYADLKYTILSDLGGILLDERSLTDNANVTERTEDRYLVSAVTSSNDLIGIIWVRSIYRIFGSGTEAETKSNQNLYFTILDENGTLITPAQNLTDNTDWRGKNDLGVPYFITPRIATTDDDHFIMAWTKDVEQNTGKISDIEYVVYDSAGSLLKSRTLLTNGQPADTYYITPMIEKIKQNRVLISYSVIDPALSTSALVYQIVDSAGTVQPGGETPIADSAGATTHDGIHLGSTVLMAWASAQDGDVGFILLDADTTNVITPTQHMSAPNFRDAASVSVGRDESGRGIITWADRNQSQYLYYTLVSETGVLLTPEMMYLAAQDSTINTNAYGYGLAAYEGTWQALMPLTSR